MNALEVVAETFTKTSEERQAWEDRAEDKFEPLTVPACIDVTDIMYYMGVRDDRVAVIFKNGSVLSVIDEYQTFHVKVMALL